jgi:hypothetical protein
VPIIHIFLNPWNNLKIIHTKINVFHIGMFYSASCFSFESLGNLSTKFLEFLSLSLK